MQRKTKIICTIGPSSLGLLKPLIQKGMDVARLNLSHGTHEEKRKQIEDIRKIAASLGKSVAILVDLQGPKLRLGSFEGTRQISKGQKVILSKNSETEDLPIQFNFIPFVKKGEKIFLNDGLVELKVMEALEGKVISIAQNNGWVSSNKGINLPETKLERVAFTEKDKKDAEFGIKESADYIALSFVQSEEDLEPLKQLIKKYKSKTKIIAKIEKGQAIENLEKIIKGSDAVMVARGDLGIELPASEVPMMQEKIINTARQYQKPVIIATQMLDSMNENPRPTRAEVSDVANAVLGAVDAVMLSNETASGKYPLEAVEVMSDTIISVEEHPEYKKNIRINWSSIAQGDINVSTLVSEASQIAERLGAKAIVVTSASGRTAKALASFRPESKIVVITHDEQTRSQLQLVWGIESEVLKPVSSVEVFWTRIIESLKLNKVASKGDKVVIVSGSLVGVSGKVDTIKTITI